VGLDLPNFTEDCLRLGRPEYLRILQSWRELLPRASITVRPLIESCLVGGTPASDFFDQMGFQDVTEFDPNSRLNASMDYSILHVLMRGHDKIFSGIHDNAFVDKLEVALPDFAKQSNAELLSFDLKERIENHYREENIAILRDFCKISNVTEVYDQHFSAYRSEKSSYLEMNEVDIIDRCIMVLAQSDQTEEVEILTSISKDILSSEHNTRARTQQPQR
jgi:hypothetical protein